jgi:hypothetical protein
MEGVIALLIPVLALATGLVAVIRMPPEALAGRKRRTLPAPDTTALEEEVALLREELTTLKERVDFTERLLMEPGSAAARLAPPFSASASVPTAPAGEPPSDAA